MVLSHDGVSTPLSCTQKVQDLPGTLGRGKSEESGADEAVQRIPDAGHTIKARESPCQKENDELCHKKRYGKGHHKLLHMIGGGDEGESSRPRVPCSVPELNQHETGPVLCGSGAVV
jgi:hypothetical protein